MDTFDHEKSFPKSSDNNFIQVECVYNISYEKHNSINFLADYSDLVQRKKITDSKISKTEEKYVDSDMELASLHIDHFGNYSEDDPLLFNNLIQNNHLGRARHRHRNENGNNNDQPLEEKENETRNRKRGRGGSPKKSKKIEFSDKLALTALIRNELEMPTIDDNLIEKSPGGLNHNMPLPKDNKTFDSNTSTLAGLANSNTNFNDEAFEKIIKEFLNINDFPEEAKEKLTLVKKFISIYKKIKDNKTKLSNFIKKISEKLKEPYDEIRDMFEFEYLRNKREGTFANLSKLINKLINSLKEFNINDVSSGLSMLENDDIQERRKGAMSKVQDYMAACEDIQSFFQRGEYVNQTIEKFIPSFKLSKLSGSEGRDKILKKLKECLEKNNISYIENSLAEIIFPNIEGCENDRLSYENSLNGDVFFDNKNPMDYYQAENKQAIFLSNFDVTQVQNEQSGSASNPNPSSKLQNVSKVSPAQGNSLTFLQYVSNLNCNGSQPAFGDRYCVKQYNKYDFPDCELKQDDHSK